MRPFAAEMSPQAERVVDAALACIARVGLAKTTLDDVAREAGCARATVYRCFPNKVQLLGALVAREAQRLGDALLVASARNGSNAGATRSAALRSTASSRSNARCGNRTSGSYAQTDASAGWLRR